MTYRISALLVSLAVLSLFTPGTGAFDHSPYNRILEKYVNDSGRVNYTGLKADPGDMGSFQAYLNTLAGADTKPFSKDEALAFWINAYNAFTIKSILDNIPISGLNPLYPSNSIRQIRGVWKKIIHNAAGRSITLSDIEHEIIRKEFNEPRIHFAVVCASVGCPPLQNRAYTAENLETMLESAAKAFLSNREYNRYDPETGSLEISKIFKWFGEDFARARPANERLTDQYGETDAAVVAMLIRYLPVSHGKQLNSREADINYLPYNWSLNEQN